MIKVFMYVKDNYDGLLIGAGIGAVAASDTAWDLVIAVVNIAKLVITGF